MNIFPKTPNFNILGQRRFFLALSLAVTVLILLVPLVRRPNWGVDFAGGNELRVQFRSDVKVSDIRKTVDGAGFTDANIQTIGDPTEHEYLIRMGQSSLFTNTEFETRIAPILRQTLPMLAEGASGISYRADSGDQVTLMAKEGTTLTPDAISSAFSAAQVPVQEVRVLTNGREYSVLFKGIAHKTEQILKASLGNFDPQIRGVEQVGASVGSELKIGALKSVLVALLLILLYIGFRFDFAFAAGAIVSLIHVAIIVVGYYLVSGAELNNTTIAAVLTMIGYSMNDTVIIFDRIRENMRKHPGRELLRTINDSINETLSRSIITHFTVMLSLIGLLVFTVGTLREFAFAMVIGVIAGTYSSIYIASPVVIWIEDVMSASRAGSADRGKTVRVAAK